MDAQSLISSDGERRTKIPASRPYGAGILLAA
jgi:hypothetical protein